MQFLFHIGRNIELALAELGSLIGFDSMKVLQKEFLLVDSEVCFDQNFLDKLGGSIAVYKVLDEFDSVMDVSEIAKFIATDLELETSKINLAFGSKLIDKRDNLNVLKATKKILKSRDQSCRFVEKFSTAALYGSGFKKGKVRAYRMVKMKGNIYFVKLVALQDINMYSLRDYEKPYRDAKLGMHPPKLSQIMLNLAGEYDVVYDPFCGTGTVLMEAALQHKEVIGSDIQPENIFGTIKNLEWLRDNFDIDYVEMNIFQSDARQINNVHGTDVVVTEGYLGKPKKGNEKLSELESEMSELESLYFSFLKNLSDVLDKKCELVINFPIFVYKKDRIKFKNLVDKLKPLGYSVSALLPDLPELGLREMETLLYKRDDQRVYRQIVRLTYIPG
jgi:tRNA G10  N-methylase Trm11